MQGVSGVSFVQNLIGIKYGTDHWSTDIPKLPLASVPADWPMEKTGMRILLSNWPYKPPYHLVVVFDESKTSRFNSMQRRGHSALVIGYSATMTVLSSVLVILRLVSRRLSATKFWWECVCELSISRLKTPSWIRSTDMLNCNIVMY